MGGGRRQVRLRAAIPLADDRRQGRGRTKGKNKMTIVQLIQAMEEPATQDLRGYRLLPTIFKAIGRPKSPALRQALVTLRTWHEHGAHRRDLNRDGVYDETPAIQLMDAWWPNLLEAEFRPVARRQGLRA